MVLTWYLLNYAIMWVCIACSRWIFDVADSFHYLYNEELNETIDLSRNGIAWETDREVRFRNDSNLAADLQNTNMPPNWPRNISGLTLSKSTHTHTHNTTPCTQ